MVEKAQESSFWSRIGLPKSFQIRIYWGNKWIENVNVERKSEREFRLGTSLRALDT